MSMEVGRIDLGLDVNQKDFNRQLYGIAGGAEKGAKKAFSGLGAKIGFALGGAALVSFAKSCLDLGSSLTEVQNVVDTVFPSMNGQVNSFAQNAMEQFGLSETVAKKYMGTLGAMSKSMGFSEQAALSMAEGIAGLSGDVASFYNMSSDEAYTKLKSIWTGETESLKELGVIMTQTNLDQYAMNNGFGKTASAMDEQTKTMLRYQYVTSALSAAQGDFAKTSDSWANQVRVLSLRFDSLKATLGQGFINLLTPLIQGLNSLIGKLQGAANAFKSFTELVTGKTIKTSTGAIANNALGATENILGMGDAAEKSAKKAAKSLAGFDELNLLSNQDNSNSSAPSAPENSTNPNDTIGINNELSNSLNDLKNKLQPVTDAFKDLWKSVRPFAKNIGEGIKWFYDYVIVPVSEITITKVIPEFFDMLGSAVNTANTAIEKFKDSDGSGTILSFISDLAKSQVKGIGKWFSKIGDAFDSLTAFINNPSIDTFVTVLEDVFGAFLESPATPGLAWLTGEILDLTGINLRDWFDANIKPWIDPSNWPNLIKQNAKDALKTTINIYAELITTWNDLKDDWDKLIKNFVGGAVDWIVNLPQTVDQLSKDWGKLTASLIKGSVDWVINLPQTALELAKKWALLTVNLVGKSVEFLIKIPQKWSDIQSSYTKMYEKFVSKSVKFLISVPQVWNDLKDDYMAMYTKFAGKTVKFLVSIPQVWNDLKSNYEALTKYFKGKTVDFVVNLITSLGDIKDFVNSLIKEINTKVIAKLTFTVDIPFTDKDWIWKAPQIPMLAEGGYVGANQPRLAMIGDNKREGEIVSPESKFQEMLNKVAQMYGNNGISEEMLYRVMSRVFKENQLVAVPDGNGIIKIVKQGSDEYRKITGKPLFGY